MENIYFYYNSSTQSFLFGPEKGQIAGIGATANSFSFDDWINSDKQYPFRHVINRWFQIDLSGRRASYVFINRNAKLDFVCVDDDVRPCWSETYYLNETVTQETSSGNLVYLNIPGENYYQIMPEAFRNSRPVYKQMGSGAKS